MQRKKSTEGDAADEDLVDVAFQRLEAEARSGEPVRARHLEQISRARTVSRQQHRADHEAARRERIGQIAHRQRHVGQSVQEENATARALAHRRRATRAGRAFKGRRSRELQIRVLWVPVHLVAFEPGARLQHVVVEIAITAGIEGQTLTGGLKAWVGGVRTPRRRIGRKQRTRDNESERDQHARRCGSRSCAHVVRSLLLPGEPAPAGM